MLLGMLALTGSFAQNTEDTTRIVALEELVITAQFAPQSIDESVFKMKVLKEADIQAKGANNLRELLLHELNIDLTQKSVFGSSIDIQGISKENVKILVDGTPVVGRLNGVIDLNQLVLDDVERIEIIQGPTSVYYGTDALAGVINIITNRQQRHKITGNLSSYYESVGQYNLSGKIGYRSKNDLVQISGGRNFFEGYSAIDTTRNKQWESREQYFAKANYTHYFKDLWISNSAKYFIEEQLELGNPDPTDSAKDVYYTTRRWNYDAGLSGYTAKNKYINVVFSYSDYLRWSHTYDVDLSNNSKVMSDAKNDHDTTRFDQWFLKGQFSQEDNKLFNYSLGYDISLESIEGKRILDTLQTMENYAIFGGIRYTPFEKLALQPGLRYTYNNRYNAPLSPAINVKYDLGKNASLRASYARGYRAPSLKELYLEFYVPAGPFTYHIHGNEDLKPEQSNNISLSFTQAMTLGKERSLKIEPSLFYNDIDNLIALNTLVNFERYYININRHKTYGGKVDVVFLPVKNLTLGMGFSHIERYNIFSEDHEVTKYTSTNDLNGRLNYSFSPWNTTLLVYYKYNGKRPGYFIENGTGDLQETHVAGYHILDINLTKTTKKEQIKLSIGAKNLLDVTNIESVGKQTGKIHSTDLALWGRTFFLKLSMSFRKGNL
ncbi:MAG: TonB-dependent receptor [Cytophagales bacterium]|nr:TonB-dependent receptor [Cytophagales bacterium]